MIFRGIMRKLLEPSPEMLEARTQVVTLMILGWPDVPDLCSQLEPAPALRHFNELLETACKVLLAREAMIVQFVDEQVRVMFGAPQPVEDHARRAVLAALAVRQEQSVRVAVHTGAVALGVIGGSGRSQYGPFGRAVFEVAQLYARTPGQSFWVSAATRTAAALAGPEWTPQSGDAYGYGPA